VNLLQRTVPLELIHQGLHRRLSLFSPASHETNRRVRSEIIHLADKRAISNDAGHFKVFSLDLCAV
jgi:hypothetical protein